LRTTGRERGEKRLSPQQRSEACSRSQLGKEEESYGNRRRYTAVLHRAGVDGLMDPLLTEELELTTLDGSERTLRAMLGRERAERIEAQEKAKQLERKLQRLGADLDRERRRSAGMRARLLQKPRVSEEHNC
jgi:hypothetical protein